MTLIDPSVLNFHPFVSRENPNALYLPLTPIDFERDSDFQFQVQSAIQRKRLEFQFQSLYLDAAEITSGTTYVYMSATNQRVGIRAGYQGYRPVVCNPGDQGFIFSNAGANAAGGSQVLRVMLLNVPVIGTEWAILAGAASGGGSAVWG